MLRFYVTFRAQLCRLKHAVSFIRKRNAANLML